MVRKSQIDQVDELEVLTNASDPNYYSPFTKNSAFSYVVEYKNIDFALLLLNKMKGEYEYEKGKYFQRDLKNLSELFGSDLFKTAYEENKSDEDNLIVQWAKALTIEESYKQKGSRLKNGKTSTINRYPVSSYGDEIKKLLEQYDNHIEELKHKMEKRITDIKKHFSDSSCMGYLFAKSTEMKKGQEADKISKIKVQESIKRKYKKRKQNLKEIYTLEGEGIEFSFLLNVISWVLLDNWGKKFNTPKIKVQEAQAMLVLEHLPNSEISHKIYVAANPYIQSLDNQNEMKEIISVKKDKVTVIDSGVTLLCELAEELLNEIKLKELQLVKNIFSKKDPKRHAEEVLCDNIQNQTQSITLKRIYIYIYGTKRPCLSCYSRMQMEKEKGYFKICFSKDHGKFWQHAVSHVGETISGSEIREYGVAINTLKLLATSTVTE